VAQKIYIRHAQDADINSVCAFYYDHPHVHVKKRDHKELKSLVENGAVTVGHLEDGTIVACCIGLPMPGLNDTEHGPWSWIEIGAVRTILPGMGLSVPVINAHLAQTHLLSPPQDCFVLGIAEENIESRKVFERIGSISYTPSDSMMKAHGDRIRAAQNDRHVKLYTIPNSVMPQVAKNLLQAEEDPILKNKITGQEYELDFSRHILFSTLKPVLEALAGKPNQQAPLPTLSGPAIGSSLAL
jgi:hypothetical protein